MLPAEFRKFGWFDRVGPLWFLRHRWSAGTRWRSCWARYFAAPLGVALQCHSKRGGYAVAGCFIPWDLWEDLSYAQKEDIVMGWVRQVRRPDSGGAGSVTAVDPVWLSEFPALHEYMVLSTHSDGSARRTSTLTVFVEHSSWKCFLNERDADASLCATGSTVTESLSALEVMLESESPPWRFSDRNGKPPARKGGKGT